MKKLGIGLFRKKTIQASTKTGLAASVAVPDSGITFVNNSQGASSALIEFTNAISAAVDHMDLDDDSEHEFRAAQLRKLERAVGEYSNSNAESCGGLTHWMSTKPMAEIVNVAFQCAAAIYNDDPTLPGHRSPKAVDVTFTEVEYSKPSIGGTAKAIGAWTVKLEMRSSDYLPALVIAIRGSASILDHMVNANRRPVLVNEFMLTGNCSFLRNFDTLSAHAGFLNSAKALIPRIMTYVSRAQSANINHIILTGHSAGGAVANLLFLRLLLNAANTEPTLRFSCATFGAPPTLNTDITAALHDALELRNRIGFNLAFVNEFDIVPRADQTYIRSLIDIYRSVHNLPPLMNDAICEHDSNAENNTFILPPLVFDDEEATASGHDTVAVEGRHWKLPRAEYHIIGDLVLLRKVRMTSSSDQILLAHSITLTGFQNLVYCGKETHSRTAYGDRVAMMLRGKFNHKEQW